MAARELEELIAGLRTGGPDFTAPPQKARADFERLLQTLPVAEDIDFAEAHLG